jgi:hypothetical protein
MVCVEASQRCVLILSNDVRSEAGFKDLVNFILATLACPMTGNTATAQENRDPANRLSVLHISVSLYI